MLFLNLMGTTTPLCFSWLGFSLSEPELQRSRRRDFTGLYWSLLVSVRLPCSCQEAVSRRALSLKINSRLISGFGAFLHIFSPRLGISKMTYCKIVKRLRPKGGTTGKCCRVIKNIHIYTCTKHYRLFLLQIYRVLQMTVLLTLEMMHRNTCIENVQKEISLILFFDI